MTFKNYMPYTEGEKRYHTLSYDLSHRFGGRVWKAAVDAGFTCPNRDGTKAVSYTHLAFQLPSDRRMGLSF